MNKNLLYIMFICIILGGAVFLWKFSNNTHESRFGYTVNFEYEIIDITPVHTGYNIKIENQKGPQFNNEKDCKARAREYTKNEDKIRRVCYNIDPEDWVGFYMGDSEPRPVFKTYEECEDRAISMMPYSLVENAEGGVHAGDGDTRCSQGCHYGYVYMNKMTWVNGCDKTIHSMIGWADKFEKIMDKLDEGWNYERFENAFKSQHAFNSQIGCDIKLNYPNNPVYSYLVGIRFSYDLDEWRANVPKMHLKQKILKDEKTFYVQQYEGKIYVWGEIFDEGYGKVYSIKGDPMNLIFENTKWLFEDENLEIDCHGDFNNSPNDWKELYSLPKDITWIDGGSTDNIYQRLYEY